MSLVGTQLQSFSVEAFQGFEFKKITDADLKGKWSVVFFYPADFTFVCPTELEDLADNYAEFKKIGCEIYSVSTDTHFTHKAWHDSSEAIKKVEQEQRSGRAFRPIVYICSPYAGDIAGNVDAARRYSRFAVDKGYIPIAPHLLYPQFLDDADPDERELGIFFGNAIMSKCSEVWVFGSRISAGMQAEIRRAKWKNYRLRYFTEDCQEV